MRQCGVVIIPVSYTASVLDVSLCVPTSFLIHLAVLKDGSLRQCGCGHFTCTVKTGKKASKSNAGGGGGGGPSPPHLHASAQM
jgi:hypothetical protein